MAFFGWIAGEEEPPEAWDLRHSGWDLCHGKHGCRAECRHVLICDTRHVSAESRLALAEADRPAWRLIMLGVEQPAERARLLSLGVAEALSADTSQREFGLLWRLSDNPGERVTRKQLLSDVWRINHEPETNSVEVHVSRLRSKLALAGCETLVETAPEGGYRLAESRSLMFSDRSPKADTLDRYLREVGWTHEQAS